MSFTTIPATYDNVDIPATESTRGSLWYSADGAPTDIPGAIDQDHYLDLTTGDVWVFTGGAAYGESPYGSGPYGGGA